MKKSIRARGLAPAFSVSVLSLACGAAWAQSSESLADVTVTATRVEFKEMQAPYAVEVHTRSDIEKSGAVSLFDYLSKFTGLQVGSTYGNKEAPILNMRGYGLDNGFQNIVVSLNGQRLNNIDQSAPQIGGISLQDIERIEITRGVGSTLYGDGAMAGTVQIITKPLDGARAQIYAGSYGEVGSSTQVGMSKDQLQLAASTSNKKFDGFVNKDASGQSDSAQSGNWRVDLGVGEASDKNIKVYALHSNIDTRYNDYMSNAQWLSNPFLNKGITHQQYLIDGWGVNSNVEIAAGINLGLKYQDQSKKSSVAYWYGGNSDYDYSQQNTELSISGRNQDIKWVGGVQISNGSRFDNVSAYGLKKDNQSIFGQFHKYFGNLVWMLGAREEQVHYEYSQAGNASLSQNNKLPQWETGLNYIQDENTSWFGTYSRSYQSPDVDRFFNATYDVNYHVTGESFNGFIVPALAKTATIGFNLKTEQNKLTASLYRANLTNEIYYDNVNSNNTNIDASHKQGFELRDRWAINDKVLMHSNYTYTVAKIDNANSTNPAFAGKNLPGVSRHMLVWGVRWNPYGNHTLNLNQTWRSRAYALDDFLNNYAVQIPIQRSTDATYQYAFTQNTQVFASVNNLFNQSYALVTYPNSFYATDFARTWRVGLKMAF